MIGDTRMCEQRTSYALTKQAIPRTIPSDGLTDTQRRVVALMADIEQRAQQPMLILQPDGNGNWRIHETKVTR